MIPKPDGVVDAQPLYKPYLDTTRVMAGEIRNHFRWSSKTQVALLRITVVAWIRIASISSSAYIATWRLAWRRGV